MVYGYCLARTGRRWPYACAAGAALVGGGLLANLVPVALLGVAVMGLDVFLVHRHRLTGGRERPR